MFPKLGQHHKLPQLNTVFPKSCVLYPQRSLDREMTLAVMILIYFLTAVGLTPGVSSTVHSYPQTVHRKTQLIWEQCGPCPVYASYTMAATLELRKKDGKTSVRVAEECRLAR